MRLTRLRDFIVSSTYKGWGKKFSILKKYHFSVLKNKTEVSFLKMCHNVSIQEETLKKAGIYKYIFIHIHVYTLCI